MGRDGRVTYEDVETGFLSCNLLCKFDHGGSLEQIYVAEFDGLVRTGLLLDR
jgi:hypothetical protein